MTRRLAQSTAYTVMLKLFLSSDHVTAATGKTVAITLSKAGGAFGNPNAGASNATEVANGWYKFALDTTDTGTLGDLIVRGTSASCDDTEQVTQVVSATTGGATNLDAAVSAVKTQTDKLTFTVANQIDANVLDWKSSTAPAMTGDAYARLGAPAGASVSADVAAVKVDTAAIKAKTDNLPAAPAATGDIPTANANADALLDRANGIETGFTLRQAFRLIAAVLVGKASGGGSGTETFRDLNDTKDRVISTNTSVGNRTAVTKDAT